MSVTSTEFFVNLRKEDIPPWNDLLPFEDQPYSTQQFWNNEAEKVLNGVTINGFFFHPLLYWHLNFWHTPIDIKRAGSNEIEREVRHPTLRDNELFFIENYHEAQKQGLNLLMFGTRRFGKALLDTEVIYTENGPKPIGLAMFGDRIFDESGQLVTIKGVYPQGYVDTYKITLEDGRKVICCGDHLWKARFGELGLWATRNTKSLIGKKDIRIPLCESIRYKARDFDIHPGFYAACLASYIQGNGESPLLTDFENAKYIMSSPQQRDIFIQSFITNTVGIETGYDSFVFNKMDKKALFFIKQMFWASGYFCKTDDMNFIFSNKKKDVQIVSIEKSAKRKCTCIEVNNDSRLFLTTNHIVTHNTALISSYIGYHSSTKYNSTNSVIGGSAKDLLEIAKYTETGLDSMHPYFRFSRIGNDFSKGVVLGARDKDNTRRVYSYIDILNADMGKTASTQKPAGATPSSSVFDEVGKFNFLGPYLAALPSFSTEFGPRLTAILAGTSGEIEKCEDVQKVMNDPLAYKILTMNWDVLDKRAGEHKTWKRRSWSTFVPGQMAYSEYTAKDKTTLDKYLGLKKAPQLAKIKISVTNWERASKNLEKELKRLEKGDKKNYANFKMYYPRDPDDCFSNANINRYPIDLAGIRKRELEAKGQVGVLADVWLNDDKTLGWKYSEKQLAPYPFQGGIMDSPVQIFEFPDKEYNSFDDYVYVAGQDPYKKDTSTNSSSLGSLYIYKRKVRLGDPYGNRIVCSYVARPANMDYFCDTCRALLWAYGARCLMENADVMFETYLKRINEAEMLLVRGDDISGKLVKPGSYTVTGKYGLSTATYNQIFLEGLGVRYTWGNMMGEDGSEVKAIQLIDDVQLLTEYMTYKPGANVDRIVGFHHALALADYYDYMKYFPKSPEEKEEERKRIESMKKRYRTGTFTKVYKTFR